jgi:hypothetical protein
MSVQSFLDDFFEQTDENPLNNRERLLPQPGTRLTRPSELVNAMAGFKLRAFGQAGEIDSGILFGHIRTFEHRRGNGTRAMLWLQGLADIHCVQMCSTARATGHSCKPPIKGLTTRQLIAWYRRHGWMVEKNGDMRYVPTGTTQRVN